MIAHHIEEFIKSGIPKEIAESIFKSVSDTQEIADFLGWEKYFGSGGWLYVGIDPETGLPTGIGQFKPDVPLAFPDKKPAKYLTQKKGWDASLVQVPGIDIAAVLENPVTKIRLGEGIKKAASVMCNGGGLCLSLSGVDMGFIKKDIVPTLKKFAVEGRPIEFLFDADIVRKEGVQKALRRLGGKLSSMGCEVTVRLWDEALGKGVDDVIVAIGWERFLEVSHVLTFEEWCDSFSTKRKRPPEQSVIAQKIADLWKDKLAWRPNYQKWYRYGAEIEGIWSREPEELIGKLIALELAAENIDFSAGYLAGILKLLKIHLVAKAWDETPGFIPTKNGVLDMNTLELLPHEPSRKLTWCLPYAYDKTAHCEPILKWLKEAVGGNESILQLLRAYFAAIIRGRSDLHGFVEFQGPGGSGKTTCLELAKALVGARNTHTTRLKKLENSTFETAALFGKKLILIDDSDKYVGSVEVLKSLTGGGEIPYEEKHIQQGQDNNFICKAKVLIACNEGIQSSDYTSGLQRRRINIPFLNQVAKKDQRTLLDEVDGELKGEFAEFMPGLLNWVLALDSQTIENYLRRTEEFVVGHRQLQLEAILQTNPIADWADYCLVYEPGARLQVGIAQPNREGGQNSYLNVNSWAYASYREYCINAGMAKDRIMSLRRFIPLVKDLFINQLKLTINHCRDRACSFFENLKIRTEFDDIEPLISGLPVPEVEQPPTPELTAPTIEQAGVNATKPATLTIKRPTTPIVEPVTPPWETFPSAKTDSTETRKNKALACCKQLRKAIAVAKCRKELLPLQKRWTKEEVSWIAKHVFSAEERRKLQAILATEQQELDL